MKMYFKLLDNMYSIEGDLICEGLGEVPKWATKNPLNLQVGVIVKTIEGKEGVVTHDHIYTRKEVGYENAVSEITKKYSQLKIRETYLKGLVEITR